MKNVKMTICLVAAVVSMTAGQGFGYIYFNDGGTHDIISTIYEDVWVDYQASGMPTTVNLLEGGLILGPPYKLQGFNNSRLNILGGSVNDWLYANDSSRVTISAGGGVHHLYAYDNSQITMLSGYVGDFYAIGNSEIRMSGGTIGHGLLPVLQGNAKLIIDGSNFAIDGIPVGFGEIKSRLGGSYTNEPYRTLTGTLASGDIINNQFQIGETAKIVLVPEPATLLLLGLGAVMLRRLSFT